MASEVTLIDTFISNSSYLAPVDRKKLDFIFSAITSYAVYNKKKIKSLNILEVGCGAGGITIPLVSLGCHVRAIDLDQDVISYIQSVAAEKNFQNLVVTVDDGCKFVDNQFYDIVIVSEVFEHVLRPFELAKNIKKRMVKGSRMIVTTPNGYGPWEWLNRINVILYLKKWNVLRRYFGKPLYIKESGVDHCQFYTQRQLINMFSSLEFKLVTHANSDFILSIFGQLRNNSFLGKLDVTIADNLPAWAVSGWYFVFTL
jgi:2-polyprenyl-3-methyl-5-hydroxy-6-metoxy-1,4-benzoquinol methylase